MGYKGLLQGTVIILLLAVTLTVAACGGGALSPTATPDRAAMPVPPTPVQPQEVRASIDGNWEGATLDRWSDLVTIVRFEGMEERIQGSLDFPRLEGEDWHCPRSALSLQKYTLSCSSLAPSLTENSTVTRSQVNLWTQTALARLA